VVVGVFLGASRAEAQEHPTGQTEGVELPRNDPEAPTLSAELSDGGPTLNARFGGYVENSITWSFNEPDNGLIAWRGFDNRHATFNFENVNLSMRLELDRVYTLISLQAGRTPDTYYLGEPSDDAGTPFGVGASSAATYRFIQEAYLGWLSPILDDVAIEAGLFLSPVGIESLGVYDNWNWSRSNLFYALPFYHLGIHVATRVTDEISVHLAGYNGVNNVLDNNVEKSVAAWVGLDFDWLSAQVLYFGGVERDQGNWRSLFDGWAEARIASWLHLALHADGGFENDAAGRLGWWFGGALYVKAIPTDWLAVSATTTRASASSSRRPRSSRPRPSPSWSPPSSTSACTSSTATTTPRRAPISEGAGRASTPTFGETWPRIP
jgi:hypothetical protein